MVSLKGYAKKETVASKPNSELKKTIQTQKDTPQPSITPETHLNSTANPSLKTMIKTSAEYALATLSIYSVDITKVGFA